MKNTVDKSYVEYQKRIQKAIDYIHKNLERPLSLKEVSTISCFSEYHFHRLFSAVMKEPLGEYITRKRMERAAIRIAYGSDVSVSDIAFEFGYSSVSSFSKAFKQWYGLRPTEIKALQKRLDAGDGKLQKKYETPIEFSGLYSGQSSDEVKTRLESIQQKVRVDEFPEVSVCYKTSPDGYDISSIQNTWIELAQHLEKFSIDISLCERFSISHDHPGLTVESKCRYDACVQVPENLDVEINLPQAIIPAGKYAVYPVQGPPESILEKYIEFYTIWMPQSEYEPDTYPVVERYTHQCESGIIGVELRAKIKPLSYC